MAVTGRDMHPALLRETKGSAQKASEELKAMRELITGALV